MPHDGREWERCPPDDPNRCQASGLNGQCPYKAKPGLTTCIRHSSMADTLAARKAANMYRLNQYQQRVEEFTTNDEVKNLRAEIGILRMTLENYITQCGGDHMQLLAYSGKIADTAMKISVLIKTCQKLEIELGSMLDRDKVMLVGQKIVEIISEYFPKDQQDKLDMIGEQIVTAIINISIGNVDIN